MAGPRPATPRPLDAGALAEALGAQEIAPGVMLAERRLEPRLRHGRQVLRPDAAVPQRLPEPLLALARRDPLEAPAPSRLLYLDTETSGLAGGSGTWVFLTGLLWGEPDGWVLRQYLLTRLDAEPAYLEAVRGAIDPDSLLVSYNGRAFDAPLLTTRLRLCGQPDPLADIAHLDLLAPVRRAFGRVWPDCRLASAESRLLGFEREGDLPGSAAPAAWLGWLRNGEAEGLGGVLRHNRWDLLSLAGLIPALGAAFEDPVGAGADTHAVAAHHLAQGRAEKALGLLEADRRRLSAAGLLDLAKLYRQQGRWAEACAIWEALASDGSQPALSALAKFHEHKGRDPARALDYALALEPGPERERRCARLRLKLQASASPPVQRPAASTPSPRG